MQDSFQRSSIYTLVQDATIAVASGYLVYGEDVEHVGRMHALRFFIYQRRGVFFFSNMIFYCFALATEYKLFDAVLK